VTRSLPVRIGLEMNGEGISIQEVIEFGVQAEDAGFDSVWHIENQRDPFVPLSVIGSRTERVRIGTALAIWARSPVLAEIVAANLDELTDGRFILGLGTAPREWNENWHGISYERPAERMREYVDVIRRMWTAHSGRSVSYEGKRFKILDYQRAMKPFRERIPIYLGAVRENMVRLAGAVADGVLFNVLTTQRYLREYGLVYLAAGATPAGRSAGDLEVGTLILTAVSSDGKEARQRARHQIAYYAQIPYFDVMLNLHGFQRETQRLRAAAARGDERGMINTVTDEMVEALSIAGTPDECRRKLLGFDGLVGLALLLSPAFRLDGDEIRENHRNLLGTFGA
jgi:5,10-methylenetetrahydromethanopterin reductase